MPKVILHPLHQRYSTCWCQTYSPEDIRVDGCPDGEDIVEPCCSAFFNGNWLDTLLLYSSHSQRFVEKSCCFETLRIAVIIVLNGLRRHGICCWSHC